jgi:hypothetical protein
MTTPTAPSRARRTAGVVAFLAAATTLGAYGAFGMAAYRSGSLTVFAAAALAAAAAYGVGRASALSQVLSRGVGWALLAPAVMSLGAEASRRVPHWDPWSIALTVTLTAGLLLSRPLLDTARAQRDFHPVAVRAALLSGAVASIAAALWSGYASLLAYDTFAPRLGLEFAAASAALAASAIAVVRMRSWGVLLGALTSATLLGAAMFERYFARTAFVLAATPGAILTASVLFARLRPSPPAPARVAELTPVRTRVVLDEADTDDLTRDTSPSTRLGQASRHPARATIA